ncbi:excinuclease ATPase subunit [Acidovorax sp. A1169]|uniref:excinuclease ATPase subunit n=1 Tax=Acidovorax sp. A1169 TaxID=3059524 RepID=UPI00273801E5|nr:excinuclease ATPase subunit [Acidovorax sp. A1169]MDP4076783.1 excinuclease ATPase subunit [Acidovorax sp. A1169]
MSIKKTILALAVLAGASMAAHAEKVLMLPLEEAVQLGLELKKLDGSVKFYLSGAPTPEGGTAIGEETANRKTSSGGRTKEEACHWVALSTLISLEEFAKKRGANAVVDLHSTFKGKVYKDPVNYECHAGSMLTGVTFKGTYVRFGQ